MKQNGKDVDNSGCRQIIKDSKFTTVLVCQGIAECKAGDKFNVIDFDSEGAEGREFAFVRAVGEAVLGVYPRIVARRKDTPYDDAARERLFVKRGRYVEFNLVYDRGTRFGFSTDADPDAYLMSLPPVVKW